jgi:hypothetical protein
MRNGVNDQEDRNDRLDRNQDRTPALACWPQQSVEDRERSWKPVTAPPWVRIAVRLGGLVLGGSGLLLGLGVVWTQLARALPLAELLDRPRAVPAMLLVSAGLGLLLAARRGSPIVPRVPRPDSPPGDSSSPGDV